MKKYRAYRVDWVDTMHRSGWNNEEDNMSPILNTSMGYIVKRTRDYIALAQTIGHDKEASAFSSVTSIPRGCIKKMTRIDK